MNRSPNRSRSWSSLWWKFLAVAVGAISLGPPVECTDVNGSFSAGNITVGIAPVAGDASIGRGCTCPPRDACGIPSSTYSDKGTAGTVSVCDGSRPVWGRDRSSYVRPCHFLAPPKENIELESKGRCPASLPCHVE